MHKKYTYLLCITLFFLPAIALYAGGTNTNLYPTRDDGRWFFLKSSDLPSAKQHQRHAEIFGKYVTGYNQFVLRGIDVVQSRVKNGGGYFANVKANPPESPIGYPLSLFGISLLKPARSTSYCSGATYAAFIESLNLIFPNGSQKLTQQRAEAMRMQEPNGGRREDGVKFWGHWNDDGFGSQYALVQYSGMGEEITPARARPGDFMNISWTFGGGHSVIFLGWTRGRDDRIGVAYWSSQKDTNGCADVYADSLRLIKEVKIVRLTKPHNLFNFNTKQPVHHNVTGSKLPR